jgi:hypothetical protein
MNIELFKDAIAIADGIPDNRVNLDFFQQPERVQVEGKSFSTERWISKPEDITCGTLACMAGWLCLHPDMRKHGLRASSEGVPALNGCFEYLAMARFFGISRTEAYDLFTWKRDNEKGTDKQVWLKRAMKLLAKYQTQAEVEAQIKANAEWKHVRKIAS